ncbi:MAG: hypothetical protein WDA75_25845 [Candidatus Latescibacterota bacterium]|jgi:hypothetical protein
MAGVLQIADPVVTGDGLRLLHRGQIEVQVGPKTVLTPTAWDYVRQHRLHVVRSGAEGSGPVAASPGSTGEVSPPAATAAPAGATVGNLVREVPPSQMVAQGRCDHPDRPFGCKTEEFGSGFAEPASCQDCPVNRLRQEGQASPGCEGCNREQAAAGAGAGQEELEFLVQRITDLVLEQLARGE